MILLNDVFESISLSVVCSNFRANAIYTRKLHENSKLVKTIVKLKACFPRIHFETA